MRSHNAFNGPEAQDASRIALKGAAIGAAKYGAFLTPLFILGQYTSPLYRGLTVQFKVFLMMSGMILGGAIEGDSRLREHERRMYRERRAAGR